MRMGEEWLASVLRRDEAPTLMIRGAGDSISTQTDTVKYHSSYPFHGPIFVVRIRTPRVASLIPREGPNDVGQTVSKIEMHIDNSKPEVDADTSIE